MPFNHIMPQKLNTFSNGGYIEFDKGNFDEWCVFVVTPNNERHAPSDSKYFARLKELGKKYGSKIIYDDFLVIYNRTKKNIDKSVFELISGLSRFYQKDSLEMEILFNILYAGMVAEENKKKAILKKRIKRLGVHHVLIDELEPEVAASFSKGVKWVELDRLMKAKGF